eukprot:IDg19137t1
MESVAASYLDTQSGPEEGYSRPRRSIRRSRVPESNFVSSSNASDVQLMARVTTDVRVVGKRRSAETERRIPLKRRLWKSTALCRETLRDEAILRRRSFLKPGALIVTRAVYELIRGICRHLLELPHNYFRS